MNRSLKVILIIILLVPVFQYPSNAVECINGKFLFNIELDANQPSDISMGLQGKTYLVDGVNSRIIVLDKKGRLKFTFGKRGDKKGEFKSPKGIDISEDGKVLIADSGNHRIQIFDLKGNFLKMFAVKSSPGEKPSDPVDVLASKLKGNIYVSDNENHKIKVYDKNGTFKFEWGKYGESSGEFRYPGMMAANQHNEILVVDVLNTRVQKFDPFGNHISNIGSWGVLPGKLFRPKGVVLDKKGRVFISDSYMGFVQVFTDLGRFLGVVCEKNGKRKFITPVGLAIDHKKSRLLVVEMKANKIGVMKIKD